MDQAPGQKHDIAGESDLGATLICANKPAGIWMRFPCGYGGAARAGF